MKFRSLALPGRAATLAALACSLAAGVAFAGGGPPPDPLPYVQFVQVGREGCITCPPRACPDERVLVSVSGVMPNVCVSFHGLHELPVRSLIPVLQAEFVVDTCRAACPASLVEFSGSASLPPQTAGPHAFILRVAVRTCPDTTTVVDSMASRISYDVLPDCPPHEIPVDSLVRTFVKLRTVPEHPCAGDSVTLQLVKNGCPPCVHLVSFGIDSTFAGVIDWMPMCLEFACIPETLSAPMGRLAQGSFMVSAPMTVRVLGTENPDSTIQFRLPFGFEVGPPCGGPPEPCVAREMFSSVPPHQCAVTVGPAQSGDVPLFYESALEMGGLQGEIHIPAPFRIMDLRLASGLPGVHLSWRRDATRGAVWLVFTDPGVTLSAGQREHLLDARVRADYNARPGSSELLFAAITLASSPDGLELPLCNRMTLDLQVIATRLCVAGDPAVCDVNHDGKLDVRDLVRMVSCLRTTSGDSTGTGPCPDCDSSGGFDFTDIFCCAREILRGPGAPRDSVRTDESLRVTLGPVYAAGDDRLVHVRVTGARALGATSIRFDYPADRWIATQRVHLDQVSQPVDVDWYPLLDMGDPGHVYFGALRVGESGGEDSFEFVVLMHATATPVPGDRFEGVSADFGGNDGSVIVPSSALPVLSLTAPAPPEPGPTGQIGPLALSPPQPNPFNTTTRFTVMLPNTAEIDLAVHDLAGRRVATLVHAVRPAGRQSFTWDGAGAHDGLYFVRLTVNGQVLSTRVALLRGSRQ